MSASNENSNEKKDPAFHDHDMSTNLENTGSVSGEEADIEEINERANNSGGCSSDDDVVPGRRRKHGSDEEEDDWSTTEDSDESIYSDAESGGLSDDKNHCSRTRRTVTVDNSSLISVNIENGAFEQAVEEENKVDRKNPAFVPRGRFYMHDDRLGSDEEDDKVTVEAQKEKASPQARADRTQRWSNDKFDKLAQAPKSENELISAYGYNIRSQGSDVAAESAALPVDVGNRGGRRKSASKRHPNVADFIPENIGTGENLAQANKKHSGSQPKNQQPQLQNSEDAARASSKSVDALDHGEPNEERDTLWIEQRNDFGCGPPLPSSNWEEEDFDESRLRDAPFHGRPGFGGRRRPRRARRGAFVDESSRRRGRGARGDDHYFSAHRGGFVNRQRNFHNDEEGVDDANVNIREAPHNEAYGADEYNNDYRKGRGARARGYDYHHQQQYDSTSHIETVDSNRYTSISRGLGAKFRNGRNRGGSNRDRNSVVVEPKEIPATRSRYSEQRNRVARAEWATEESNSAVEFIPRNFEEFAADAERAANERRDGNDGQDEEDEVKNTSPSLRRPYRAGRKQMAEEYEDNSEFDVKRERGRGRASRGYRRGRLPPAYHSESNRRDENDDSEAEIGGVRHRENHYRSRDLNRGRGRPLRRPDTVGREFYRRRGDKERDAASGGYVGSGTDASQQRSGAGHVGNSAAHSLEKFEPPPRFQEQLYHQKDLHDVEMDSVAQIRHIGGNSKRGYTHQRPPGGSSAVSIESIPINSGGASVSPPRFQRLAEQRVHLPINVPSYISTVPNVNTVYTGQHQIVLAASVAQYSQPFLAPLPQAASLGAASGGPVYYNTHQQAPGNASIPLSPPKRPIPIVDPSNSSSNSVKDN